MKNKIFKKSLSVLMAVLMLLSCWVFIPGEHHIEAEAVLAYGMSAASGFTTSTLTISNSGTTTIVYPNNMYIDKSENLIDAKYYLTITSTVSNKIELFPCIWGGQEFGHNYNTARCLKGNEVLVNNFTNYGINLTDSKSYFGSTGADGYFDNMTYDESYGTTLFVCGSASSNLQSDKYFLSGTPDNTGDFTYAWANTSGDPIVMTINNGSTVYKSNNKFNGTTVNFTIHVYDKSDLNTAVSDRKSVV